MNCIEQRYTNINCRELRAAIFPLFHECAYHYWQKNNERFRTLTTTHIQHCDDTSVLAIWESRLAPCLYNLSDLVAGYGINKGIWLAYHSVEHPEDFTVIDKLALLSLNTVKKLPQFKYQNNLYRRRKARAIEALGQSMKRFADEEEAYQLQTWPPLLAGHIVYTYHVTVAMFTKFDTKLENKEFTKQLEFVLGE